MSLLRVPSDLHVEGQITGESMVVPANAVTDSSVSSVAAIQATKVVHQQLRSYAQPNTTATTETKTIHVARGSGNVTEFYAGSIAINAGAATITVDLKKNGVSILSSVITLNSSNTARVAVAGTISSASYVAGDWFEVVATATAGGGTLGTGVFAQMTAQEAA